ncbi:MAG: flagellar biosynthesis anti-sigma factor FlgM [Candidatus Desulfofervidaceae bacterium]|nr:flagellar biosynthesis anti-sigma factor FlgM [Candidatus Desulfofervidaceae bacterium]MDL1970621.1 flagellar biosynthesis anti-sigma factor FlgM [Candidatus Desulfofervidaceae bacterium]
MKISGKVVGTNPVVLQRARKAPKGVQKQLNIKPNKTGAAHKGTVKEKVQISGRAQELQRLKKVVAETPAVRKEKVASVKEALTKGAYEVKPKGVAVRLLQNSIINNVFAK